MQHASLVVRVCQWVLTPIYACGEGLLVLGAGVCVGAPVYARARLIREWRLHWWQEGGNRRGMSLELQ
jgi:hypothetical protein